MTTGHRILIIDNDAHSVNAVASYLKTQGCAVFQAETCQVGLQLARTEQPDAIAIDIDVGKRGEGLAAIQEIRRIEGMARIPIFVLSAMCTDLPDFEHGHWRAEDMFIPKPVNPAQLLNRIRKHIGTLAPMAAADVEP